MSARSVESPRYFVQIPDYVLEAGLGPVAVALFGVLYREATWNTGLASVSKPDLAKAVSTSESSIKRALRDLTGLGAIEAKAQYHASGHQRENGYVIHLDPPSARSKKTVTPRGVTQTPGVRVTPTRGSEAYPPGGMRCDPPTVPVLPPSSKEEEARDKAREQQPSAASASRVIDLSATDEYNRSILDHPGFAEFIAAYPAKGRTNINTCRMIWSGKGYENIAPQLVQAAKRYAQDPKRREDNEKYTLGAQRFLDEERWREYTDEATGAVDGWTDEQLIAMFGPFDRQLPRWPDGLRPGMPEFDVWVKRLFAERRAAVVARANERATMAGASR